MSKKGKNKDKGGAMLGFNLLQEDTVRTIFAVALFVAAILFLMAAFHGGGKVGKYGFAGLSKLLGIGYYLLPLLSIILGISFLKTTERSVTTPKLIGAGAFFLAGMGIINLAVERGGIIGSIVSRPLVALFDYYASLIILVALFVASLFVIFDRGLAWESLTSTLRRWFSKDKSKSDTLTITNPEAASDINLKKSAEEVEASNEKSKAKIVAPDENDKKNADKDFSGQSYPTLGKTFTPPPLSLLESDKGKPGVGDIKANANVIKRTLQNFGIDVEMDEISIGPSVTRYALKPAEGVKLSRIVALQNDLSLALAAHPIRIEAPIPGKSLVGIEIPNSTKTTVGLATLFSAPEYKNSETPLLISLGKGVSGMSYFGNMAKMPHLLIAGATGSGKSVTIHTIITSLLYRNSSENLKFIMIDPKRVELTLYNKIPHLLTPVITDAKKAILALKWAAKEMNRRYDVLEGETVRDIESYHKNVLAPALKKAKEKGATDAEAAKLPETMPYIVIIIDELADIMSAYPRELEAAIVRLAQMSRAVGIHLMLSTQRPSVNVITGLIKANIPTRIALQVASQIDSRTILDMGGAEKLLGAGDMLYLSGDMSQPRRIQSPYISETEVKKVVQHIRASDDSIPNEINLTNDNTEKNAIFESAIDEDASLEDDDDLYEQARETVIEAGKASTSYLQRKLRIGYARAARLMDQLQERGVIGAGDGAKPRSVISGNPSESPEENLSNEV